MIVIEEREVEMSKETFFDMKCKFDLLECTECGLFFSRIEHYGEVNHLKKCVRCYGIGKKAKKVKEGHIYKRKQLLELTEETWEALE